MVLRCHFSPFPSDATHGELFFYFVLGDKCRMAERISYNARQARHYVLK